MPTIICAGSWFAACSGFDKGAALQPDNQRCICCGILSHARVSNDETLCQPDLVEGKKEAMILDSTPYP